MSIPTILRGDTPAPITLNIPADETYRNARLVVCYQGATRTFERCVPGSSVQLVLTRVEVERMQLGTHPVTMRCVTVDGSEKTIPSGDARIRVTDCPGEVYGGDISVSGIAVDYNEITNKPSINGHTLEGESSLDQIGAQRRLTAGRNITITPDGTISSTGGGGGGGSVVESDTNPGYAANADSANHATSAGTAESANEAVHAGEADYALNAGSSARAESALSDEDGNRIAETYGRKDELIISLDLVGDDPYTVQLDGVVQTFAEVKAFAETRNAVIRHGRGTYRVTYVGAAEMMWDCTGTVQGAVKTGTIHMFASGDVVQLVPARELAQSGEVAAVSGVANSALASAAYPIIGTDGILTDRAINHATAGGSFTFPARADANTRDFVLVIDALATAPSVTFPAGVTYVSDQAASDVWTAEANKVNAWYFSEVNDGVFMVSHKAMDTVTQ